MTRFTPFRVLAVLGLLALLIWALAVAMPGVPAGEAVASFLVEEITAPTVLPVSLPAEVGVEAAPTSRQLPRTDTEVAPTPQTLADVEELKVTDAKTSAKVIRDILTGKESGPRRDIIILNAAAAIIAGNLADDFESAIEMAESSVSDGKALACLEKLIEVSNLVTLVTDDEQRLC